MFTRKFLATAALWPLLCSFSASLAYATPTIVEFDPPGATDTYIPAGSIDKAGDVAGYFDTGGAATQGFLRTKDGSYFIVGGPSNFFTTAAIGPHKTFTGFESAYGFEGFIAKKDGSITPFDAPHVASDGFGTQPTAENDTGSIAGLYGKTGASTVARGFIRDPNGNFATFAAPHAGTGSNQGTYVQALNSEGFAVGWAKDDNNVYRAFERAPDGTLTSIDLPDQGNVAYQGSRAYCINDKGKIGGLYYDTNGKSHGFLRAQSGHTTIIDIPNGFRPLVTGVSKNGTAVGYYYDSNSVFHGFVRLPTGELTTFDAPDAVQQNGGGTFPQSINDDGIIAGFYYDAQAEHAFVRTP